FGIRDYSDGPIVIDELWKHSLATAGITTWLNDIMRIKGRKGLAGTGAMLHDVGKLVLQKWRPEAFRRAVIRARENKTSLMREELSELGVTHALAGTFLLNYWHLPLTLQWLVKGCHLPEVNSELPETALVYLSNQIARRMDMGLDAEEVTEIPDDIRKLLGFKAETIDELIGEGFEEYVTSALDGLKVTVSV
ncbi:HDOD domain-containing protein, partial [bacterium]|nr:HDOD domain-containing protein [bacterium]